jgi:hypothetical protein
MSESSPEKLQGSEVRNKVLVPMVEYVVEHGAEHVEEQAAKHPVNISYTMW